MKNVNLKLSNYKLVDFEDNFKYEQIDNILIKRPDSNAYGKLSNQDVLNYLSAVYSSDVGEGEFSLLKPIANNWIFSYKDIKLSIRLSNYKHIGVFPEQIIHWDYVRKLIENSSEEINVLNLFAYTGGATINAALSGAKSVVHVDALKQINNWAKYNSELSKCDNLNIRYIHDDVIKFLKREIKRNNKYQIIIMDPPSFGRGPKNELWKFHKDIDELLNLSAQLLDNPKALIISTYTKDFTKIDLKRLLTKYFKAKIETYDIKLESSTNKLLDCGVGGICEF